MPAGLGGNPPVSISGRRGLPQTELNVHELLVVTSSRRASQAFQ